MLSIVVVGQRGTRQGRVPRCRSPSARDNPALCFSCCCGRPIAVAAWGVPLPSRNRRTDWLPSPSSSRLAAGNSPHWSALPVSFLRGSASYRCTSSRTDVLQHGTTSRSSNTPRTASGFFRCSRPTLAASSSNGSGGLLPETTPVVTASTGGLMGAMLGFSEPLDYCWSRRRRMENERAFGIHPVQRDSDVADCDARTRPSLPDTGSW